MNHMLMKCRLLVCVALAAGVLAAGAVQAADEAAAKRREKWLERQKELNLRDIMKVDTPIDSGDRSRRLDIVIIGDGYDKTEMSKFDSLSEKLGKSFVKMPPFSNFANYVNIHRIWLVSPKNGFALDTEVEMISRMMSCDRAKAESLAEFAPEADIVIVQSRCTLGHSNASGKVVLLWAGGGALDTTVHEFGHAFGGLADAYVEPDPNLRKNYTVPATEPDQVNVTLEPVPELSKWHYWVTPPADRKVANYEGALYVMKDVYRPQLNCVMRTGTTFCVVCMEQMIRNFLRKVPPIDGQRPSLVHQVMCAGEQLPLTACALDYEDTSRKLRVRMDWRWYFDDQPVQASQSRSAESTYTVDTKTVGPGIHYVVVSGDLIDPRVRRDYGLAGDARYWQVLVTDYPRPQITAPDKRDAAVGEKASFKVTIKDIDQGKFTVKTEGLPKNAQFDPAAGTLDWTPGEDQGGAWLFDFVAANDDVEVRAQTQVIVHKKTPNHTPQFVGVEDVEGYEGQPMDFNLAAKDEDNDSLLFNLKYDARGKPEGLSLDRRTGAVKWTPDYTQASKYYVTAEVTDGVKTATSKILLIVNNQPIPGDKAETFFKNSKEQNSDFCLLLHSESPFTRSACIPYLKDTPMAFRTAQIARLLRDEDDAVKEEALKQIQTLAQLETKEQFFGIFLREMATKAWEFTDFPESLPVMKSIVNDAKPITWSQGITACLTRIEADVKSAQDYNVARNRLRIKMDKIREAEEEKDKRKRK